MKLSRASSFFGANLSSQDEWTLGSRIAQGPQASDIPEARRPELIEEEAHFLGSGDSREPVGFAGSLVFGERTAQDELGRVDGAARTDDAAELLENLRSRGVQVEDAVD